MRRALIDALKQQRSCRTFVFYAQLASLSVLLTWLLLRRNVRGSTHGDPSLVALQRLWLRTAETYVAGLGERLGHGGLVTEQAFPYLDAARNASVVCETGFFQGVSAHLFLTANRSSVLHSFDHHFPKLALAVLRTTFGDDRLQTYEGPTWRTLRHFRPKAPCDVVSIDGSHEGWGPYEDLVGLRPHMRCGATVLFDDTFDDRAVNKSIDNEPRHRTFYNYCTRSYWRAVREGLLQHVGCTRLGFRWRWGRFPKGFCEARALCG